MMAGYMRHAIFIPCRLLPQREVSHDCHAPIHSKSYTRPSLRRPCPRGWGSGACEPSLPLHTHPTFDILRQTKARKAPLSIQSKAPQASPMAIDQQSGTFTGGSIRGFRSWANLNLALTSRNCLVFSSSICTSWYRVSPRWLKGSAACTKAGTQATRHLASRSRGS